MARETTTPRPPSPLFLVTVHCFSTSLNYQNSESKGYFITRDSKNIRRFLDSPFFFLKFDRAERFLNDSFNKYVSLLVIEICVTSYNISNESSLIIETLIKINPRFSPNRFKRCDQTLKNFDAISSSIPRGR